jgi:anti-sigma factor RsiW
MIDDGKALARGLTCRELVDLITEYTEAALSEAERARFEAHLARCTGCRHHVGQVDATRGALRQLGRGDLTDRVRTQLIALYRDWHAQRRERG